jgi:hypothetical protein
MYVGESTKVAKKTVEKSELIYARMVAFSGTQQPVDFLRQAVPLTAAFPGLATLHYQQALSRLLYQEQSVARPSVFWLRASSLGLATS